MISTSARVLLLGACLFCLGAVLVVLALDTGGGAVLSIGVGIVCLSVIGLAVGGRIRRRERDPLQRRKEQRLWRSGPLGRNWLKGRKRLP